jgi:hypothetical protein
MDYGMAHGDGNMVAHKASDIELSDATLASDLSPSQREIMNSISHMIQRPISGSERGFSVEDIENRIFMEQVIWYLQAVCQPF